ncbi:MAG TPA: TMEM175 family protein [Streptosporangiaceae bacterium]|nr:TMEM175 family protein [Streptosporangiaceae bacterium]
MVPLVRLVRVPVVPLVRLVPRLLAAAEHGRYRVDSRRAESFSDGVFAVAITVLVFNLLPIGTGTISSSQLTNGLLHAWPQYAAYAVSFLTIGIMWLNHHTMLAHVTRVDRPLLAINLFLLMGVVAIPFPTALVAEHLTGKSRAGGSVAAVAYGLTMIAISIGYSGMWLYLESHRERLGTSVRMRSPRTASVRFSAGLAGYVVATLLAAFVAAAAALALYGVIAVYYLFDHLPDPAGAAGGDLPAEAGPAGASFDDHGN